MSRLGTIHLAPSNLRKMMGVRKTPASFVRRMAGIERGGFDTPLTDSYLFTNSFVQAFIPQTFIEHLGCWALFGHLVNKSHANPFWWYPGWEDGIRCSCGRGMVTGVKGL